MLFLNEKLAKDIVYYFMLVFQSFTLHYFVFITKMACVTEHKTNCVLIR